MAPYLYELPTTGTMSFADICIDGTESYTTALVDATTARASLRSVLKEHKHTDAEKDHLRIIKTTSDYLPHLYGIIACVESGDLSLRSSPTFSWRSTLSAASLPTSRTDVPSLHADLVFTLLTLAYTYSNLASATLASIGNYEYERTISDSERQAKDEKLNFGANLLAKASGIFEHVAGKTLLAWEKAVGAMRGERPPELQKVVVSALARLAIADSNQLAIRKLMTRSAYDSTLTPGPPLPKTHPPTSLLAKLYLHSASLYSSAHGLAVSSSSKDSGEVSSSLRRYLSEEDTFCAAMAHKWLGVDAGEASGRCGESVAYLKWAKVELETLKQSGLKSVVSKDSKMQKAAKKDRLSDETDQVKVFLSYYQKMNDSLHFLPVPSNADIRSAIPAGKPAIQSKPYEPPKPAFGPTSLEALRRQAEALDLDDNGEDLTGQDNR